MNSLIRSMLINQATEDRLSRAGDEDISEHGYTRLIAYIESFELLALELSMAIDTDNKELINKCHTEIAQLVTRNNYEMC